MRIAMKPRPELLERYELAAAEQGPFPIDWTAVFGRSAPLAVEIGYGGGEYLCWWAQQQPDWELAAAQVTLNHCNPSLFYSLVYFLR